MRSFKRSGLHRLSCPVCPCYGYFTVAMLERAGQLPSCFAPGCDETLMPERVELALLLDVDTPAVRAYEAKVNSAAKGQAWTGGDGSKFESPEFRALYGAPGKPGIVQQQRAQARQRRLSALLPTPEPLPF